MSTTKKLSRGYLSGTWIITVVQVSDDIQSKDESVCNNKLLKWYKMVFDVGLAFSLPKDVFFLLEQTCSHFKSALWYANVPFRMQCTALYTL